MSGPAFSLRPGRDPDAAGFIDLIGGCWAEYPGCVMDLDGEVPELRALASYYAGQGGAVWAAEADGGLAGMVGSRPLGGDAWEICKMYVAGSQRGTGLAQALLQAAEGHARSHGAATMKLWSDTRFTRAHRFYEKHSYVRSGPIRVLGDKSNSIEFAYAKPLAGIAVQLLDAAAAGSAEGRLAAVLKDCVDGGASVSFLPPLDLAAARAFWRRAATAVAAGKRMLFAAWAEGEIVGTVQLDLDTPPNQPHRADLAKMLVMRHARRRGIARQLMVAAEAAARAAGRTLLVLDTWEGGEAEPLYRSLGWIEVGRIPDYALLADGKLGATVVFYRQL